MKLKIDDASITRLFPSGMWEISMILNGYLVRHRYDGPRAEAIRSFKRMIGETGYSGRPLNHV